MICGILLIDHVEQSQCDLHRTLTVYYERSRRLFISTRQIEFSRISPDDSQVCYICGQVSDTSLQIWIWNPSTLETVLQTLAPYYLFHAPGSQFVILGACSIHSEELAVFKDTRGGFISTAAADDVKALALNIALALFDAHPQYSRVIQAFFKHSGAGVQLVKLFFTHQRNLDLVFYALRRSYTQKLQQSQYQEKALVRRLKRQK